MKVLKMISRNSLKLPNIITLLATICLSLFVMPAWGTPHKMWSNIIEKDQPPVDLRVIYKDKKFYVEINQGKPESEYIELLLKLGQESTDTMFTFANGQQEKMLALVNGYHDIYTLNDNKTLQVDKLSLSDAIQGDLANFVNVIFRQYRREGVQLIKVQSGTILFLPWYVWLIIGMGGTFALSTYLKNKTIKKLKKGYEEILDKNKEISDEDITRPKEQTEIIIEHEKKTIRPNKKQQPNSNPKSDSDSYHGRTVMQIKTAESQTNTINELTIEIIDLKNQLKVQRESNADKTEVEQLREEVEGEKKKYKDLKTQSDKRLEESVALEKELENLRNATGADGKKLQSLVQYFQNATSITHDFANLEIERGLDLSNPASMHKLVEMLIVQAFHFFSLTRHFTDRMDTNDAYNLALLGFDNINIPSRTPELIPVDAKTGYTDLSLAIAAILRAYNSSGNDVNVSIRGYTFSSKA